MPRYSKFRRRYRRRAGPAYSVTRKLVKSSAFSRIAESQYYAASAKLCVNPSNLTSDRVGSIVTVKHIEVQLANLPTYFGINETQNVKEYGQLGGGWICVYVPEGTNPNKPFLITVLVSLHTLCMNLTRTYWALVLGLRVVPTPRLITVLRLLIRV